MRTSDGPSTGAGASPGTSTLSSPGSRTRMARMVHGCAWRMRGVNAKMRAMLSVVGGLAIVALAVLVWQLSQRLHAAERQLAEMRSQRRQQDESRAQLERSLAVARMHLADVGAGEPPPRRVHLRGARVRPIRTRPTPA